MRRAASPFEVVAVAPLHRRRAHARAPLSGAAHCAARRAPRPRGALQWRAVTDLSATASVRVELEPRWPLRLPRRRRRRRACACAAACSSGCCTSRSEPVLVRAAQRGPRTRADRRLGRLAGGLRGGARADALRARRRRRPRAVPRALPRRPADRRARAPAALAAPVAAARALRGAGLGDLRAADRVHARRPGSSGGSCAGSAAARPDTPLRDLPSAAALAGTAPALLESFDLSAGRALALRRVAREVAQRPRRSAQPRPRARLAAAARAARDRLAGPSSASALHGQGRLDQVPAGDLALRKLVGRLRSGDPQARARGARGARGRSRPTRRGAASPRPTL